MSVKAKCAPSLAVVILTFLVVVASAAQAQTIPSVAGTTWCVHASWSDHLFSWVFSDNQSYKDTDGPTGSWTQAGASLTLISNGGFTYRVTLTKDLGNGTVFRTDTGATAG